MTQELEKIITQVFKVGETEIKVSYPESVRPSAEDFYSLLCPVNESKSDIVERVAQEHGWDIVKVQR